MTATIRVRLATRDDIALLERWDRDPAVIAAHSDTAIEPDSDWPDEFDIIAREGADVWQLLIATVDEDDREPRAIGVVRIIDPVREPYGYWHPVDDNLLAVDIWIGEPDARGRGYGSQIMAAALDRCFASPSTTAVVIDPLASNRRAISFYERVGFVPVGRRHFDDDDCLVMRIDRDSWQAPMSSDRQHDG